MLVPGILLLDSAGPWTVPVICMVLGGILLSAGVLGGGIRIKEIEIPKLNALARVLAGTVGICFLIYGVYASNNHKPELKPIACLEAKSLKSSKGGDEAYVHFINKTDKQVSLLWIDFEGQKQNYSTLGPGATQTQQTYQGHLWLVEDEQGHCLAGFMPNAPDTNAIVKK